jgi:hypothetical protein
VSVKLTPDASRPATDPTPEYEAVRRELKNLLRLSPDRGPGRPREQRIDHDELVRLRAEAKHLQERMRDTFELRDPAAEQADVLEVIAHRTGRSRNEVKAEVRHFYKEKRAPRDVLLQQQGRANSYSTLEAEDTAAASVCLSTSLPRSTRAFSTRSRV